MMLAKLLFALFLIYEAQCFKYYNTYIEHHDLDNAEEMFKEFLEATEMNFAGDEYYERLAVFTDNLKDINEMNARNGSARFGITKSSHLTKKEFAERTRCLHPRTKNAKKKHVYINSSEDAGDNKLPISKDWRNKLPPVKNQKHCLTCWIFSGIGAIEGQYADINNEVISLSEQQVQDCTTKSCNKEGDPENVFKYAMVFGGIMSEKDYPYIAGFHECTPDASKILAKVTSSTPVSMWEEEDMKKYVATTGPLSIGLDSTLFRGYLGGIMDPLADECNNRLDHAVLITGYSDDEKPHWVIRNSWGENWGENGYFRIVRNKRACSIGDYVATVTVTKN